MKKTEYESLVLPKWVRMPKNKAILLGIHPNVFYGNAKTKRKAYIECFGKGDAFTFSEASLHLFRDQADDVVVRLTDGSGNIVAEAPLSRVIKNARGHQSNPSKKNLGNYLWLREDFTVSDTAKWWDDQMKEARPRGKDKLGQIIEELTCSESGEIPF